MFIVLEGLDGAGKSTQIKLLRELFASRGIESEYVHFPRFDSPVFGELIARFLRGELGSVESVDPYIVALLFAGDRADMAPQIRAWQAEGKVVIVDRYVYSNIGYQCAKLATEEQRAKLKQWILDTEYGYYNIPRPDLSLFLDVPFSFTAKSLTEQRSGDDRAYLNGEKDIHESSLDLQQMVRNVYLEAAKSDDALQVINCSNAEGGMDTPQGIFSRIAEVVTPLLNKM
ncbi:MAG: dTMP kinase [Alistipes sp.]|nr:dTMP kinase [Alistipes sp.]MBQ7952065.1 dTMP kinase [Alistipes sp.]MBQ9963468.1 dTMP kinase [Alistipes sp.]